MTPHIESCSLCCAVCGHGAHAEICGRVGPKDSCDCAHSILGMVSAQ